MADFQIVRDFRIDAGHRVFQHEGKCGSLHGHSYTFEVWAGKNSLDPLGRVIDFSVLKEKIGTWLEENWDHAMLLYHGDDVAKFYLEHPLFAKQKNYLLPFNPTAENLALYLRIRADELLADTGIKITKVVCHETPNCRAIA